VLSPLDYNRRVGLALVCPITSQVKGYPFEVAVPGSAPQLHGVILADQLESLDWHARRAALVAHVPDSTVGEVVGLIGRLLC
jgi:mRNA interferase MazF